MDLKAENLSVKIFADGAEIAVMRAMAQNPLIKGFTTNPTLMRKAGIEDYEGFCRQIVAEFKEYPLSLEVFADDISAMEVQARQLATFGPNVYVKIPVTNTKGVSTAPMVQRLSSDGIKVNITAIMLLSQVEEMVAVLRDGVSSYISVFAGRIADTGRDPVPMMQEAVKIIQNKPSVELLWASPRELLNVIQADQVGCHIITATKDILQKLDAVGKDLEEYSLDTVKMFYQDACMSKYKLSSVEEIAA